MIIQLKTCYYLIARLIDKCTTTVMVNKINNSLDPPIQQLAWIQIQGYLLDLIKLIGLIYICFVAEYKPKLSWRDHISHCSQFHYLSKGWCLGLIFHFENCFTFKVHVDFIDSQVSSYCYCLMICCTLCIPVVVFFSFYCMYILLHISTVVC